MKKLVVGTFNVENLFLRYRLLDRERGSFGKPIDPAGFLERGGSILMLGARLEDYGPVSKSLRKATAEVILANAPDVLALQEIENLEALKLFNRHYLKGEYPYALVIDGNDPRQIDVGVLSKLPIVSAATHQFDVVAGTTTKVFSRDCLSVDVAVAKGRTLTVLVNHFKSKIGGGADKRERQAARVLEIAQARFGKKLDGGDLVVAGDLNAHWDAPELAALMDSPRLTSALRDHLSDPAEHWTHYYKRGSRPKRSTTCSGRRASRRRTRSPECGSSAAAWVPTSTTTRASASTPSPGRRARPTTARCSSSSRCRRGAPRASRARTTTTSRTSTRNPRRRRDDSYGRGNEACGILLSTSATGTWTFVPVAVVTVIVRPTRSSFMAPSRVGAFTTSPAKEPSFAWLAISAPNWSAAFTTRAMPAVAATASWNWRAWTDARSDRSPRFSLVTSSAGSPNTAWATSWFVASTSASPISRAGAAVVALRSIEAEMVVRMLMEHARGLPDSALVIAASGSSSEVTAPVNSSTKGPLASRSVAPFQGTTKA